MAIESSFNVGDVVQLKSGGPKMTVKSAGKETVWCVYFEGGKYATESFHPDCLAVSDKSGGFAVAST